MQHYLCLFLNYKTQTMKHLLSCLPSTMTLSSLSQSPFLLVIIFFFMFFLEFSSSLSTISISQNSNTSFICGLIPSSTDNRRSFVNCTSFPIGSQVPFTLPNISISALAAGENFQCLLRSPTPTSTTSLSCWRFAGSLTNNKRIYRGPMLDELDAGNSHICGRVGRTRRLGCWQWPDFNASIGQNISGIVVGGEFLCGLDGFQNIQCFGNDTDVVRGKPNGTFMSIAGGLSHACAISEDGRMECWGKIMGVKPGGVFTSMALAENRSCAIRYNGTVVCWGENGFSLPENLVGIDFLRIEALGKTFCGVATRNFSLFCWGNGNGDSKSMVFERVLPGHCEAETNCPCRMIPGSGSFCQQGAICQPCGRTNGTASPPTLPPVTSNDGVPPVASNNGEENNARKIAFLMVGCVGTVSLAMVICFFIYKYCKERVCRVHDSGRLDEVGSMQNPQMSVPRAGSWLRQSGLISMSHGGHLEEFDLQALIRATNSFSEEHKIGYGSFGSVYRTKLDDGREVAIKRAELTVSTSYGAGTKRQDKENAFLSELAQLSRVNHKNLVRLLGYCEDDHERVLVYEFMNNGTLHDHLHKLKNSPIASWTARLRVALDAARGIEYLHTYVVPPIIHRDIKSSNILLDATWTAKVSDFGLSLIGPEDDEAHLSLRAAGTIGYVDPEYYRLQQLTTKSDVYSFGVVLLELLSGIRAIHHNNENGAPRNVVDYALLFIVNDDLHRVLDPKLPPPTPYEIEAVADVGYMAADCVTLSGRDRPSMTEIITSLENALTNCMPPSIVFESTSETFS